MLHIKGFTIFAVPINALSRYYLVIIALSTEVVF